MAKSKHNPQVSQQWRDDMDELAVELLTQDQDATGAALENYARRKGHDVPYSSTWWQDRMKNAREKLGLKSEPTKGQSSKSYRQKILDLKEDIRNAEEQASKIKIEQREADLDGARSLAIAMIKLAYEDASAERLSTSTDSLQARYARAWLQDPDATALWCGLADLDGDVLAERSYFEHGRPRITPEEIAYIRERL